MAVLTLVIYNMIFAGLVIWTMHLLPQIQAVKKDGIFSGQSKARALKGTPSATKLPASLRAVSSQQGWSFLGLTDSHTFFFFYSKIWQEWKRLVLRRHESQLLGL